MTSVLTSPVAEADREILSTAEGASTPREATSSVTVHSYALGALSIAPAQIMHFAEPLGGFAEQHAYALLPAARHGLWWLQSLDEPALTFLLADPFLFDASFCIDLGDVERSTLGNVAEDEALGLVMITLPTSDDGQATANCKAPLVFNIAANLALQVLNRDEGHEVRRPIDLAAYRPHANGVRMQ